MKTYYISLLREGPVWSADETSGEIERFLVFVEVMERLRNRRIQRPTPESGAAYQQHHQHDAPGDSSGAS